MPIVLIGCRSDLKAASQTSCSTPSQSTGIDRSWEGYHSEVVPGFVTEEVIQKAIRQTDASLSLECSATDGTNLGLVVDALARVGYDYKNAKQRSEPWAWDCIIC